MKKKTLLPIPGPWTLILLISATVFFLLIQGICSLF